MSEYHEVVPSHRPIKPGTLASILKSVATHHGISSQELAKSKRLQQGKLPTNTEIPEHIPSYLCQSVKSVVKKTKLAAASQLDCPASRRLLQDPDMTL